jgi:hypothetical protein
MMRKPVVAFAVVRPVSPLAAAAETAYVPNEKRPA